MKSDENLLTCKVWHDNPQLLLFFYSSFTEQLPDERLVSQAAFGRASVGSETLQGKVGAQKSLKVLVTRHGDLELT